MDEARVMEIVRRCYPNLQVLYIFGSWGTEFEMLALSLYQKLQQERLPILEAIRRTGRVYDV